MSSASISARHDRDLLLARGHDLGVVVRDGGRRDDVGLRDVRGVVPDHRADAEARQAPRHGALWCRSEPDTS
jgi:hypothetical protein